VFDALALKQAPITLTTTGSGAATFISDTLNIPIASGGTPAGTTGQIQFNNAGAFGADSSLFWDNTNKRLGIGANGNIPTAALFLRTNTLVANDIVTIQNGQYGNPILRVRDNVTASQSSVASVFIAARIYGSNSTLTGNELDLGGYGLGSSYGEAATNAVWLNNQGNIGDGVGSSVISVSSNVYINLQTTKKYKFEAQTGNFGIGNVGTLGARLDVRAQGALSTDIALRVRNSADTDNLLEVGGSGIIKFKTGSERLEINTAATDYKLSVYKYSTEMTRISTYLSYFCYGGSGQYLGIGTNAPTHLLDLSLGGTQNQIITRFGNNFNDVSQSDVTLKFTTGYTGGIYGGNPLAYLTIGNNGGNSLSNTCKSYFKFLLNKGNTLAERASITSQSNLLLQAPTEDTNDIGVVYVPNGTAPTASIIDGFKQYSADITAGNAAPHFRTENGAVVKVYQETTAITAATLVSNLGTILTDTDTIDGYTLKQVVKALRNLGILA
jgi:hypothetical protein